MNVSNVHSLLLIGTPHQIYRRGVHYSDQLVASFCYSTDIVYWGQDERHLLLSLHGVHVTPAPPEPRGLLHRGGTLHRVHVHGAGEGRGGSAGSCGDRDSGGREEKEGQLRSQSGGPASCKMSFNTSVHHDHTVH